MNIIKKISIIITSLLISIGSVQAETWNMALAYGAGNFHSQNATEFAKAVGPIAYIVRARLLACVI